MFLSALALMAFLLALAWTASPTAVLVMSFAAGVLLSLQFLVFGIHRLINLIVWVVRVSWRKFAAPSPCAPEHQNQHQHPHQHQHAPHHSHSHNKNHAPQQQRIEMPVPCPSPAPAEELPKMTMVWVEQLVSGRFCLPDDALLTSVSSQDERSVDAS